MPAKPILSARHISLTYEGAAGALAILQDVSLTVKQGETIGLVGPSGSGKSSLLMVLAGIEAASAGEVIFHGGRDGEMALHRLDETELARFRRAHVGIVFQSFHLIPTMTAQENVALPLNFARRADAQARALALLDQVGLAERATHYPSQLSGGEQQRVALARALIAEPSLILADEPTGNLDQKTGAEIIALLFALVGAHKTSLILVTHDEQLAQRCARQLRLQDGRFTEPPAQGKSA